MPETTTASSTNAALSAGGRVVGGVGRGVLVALRHTAAVSHLAWQVLLGLRNPRSYWRLTLSQALDMGVKSIPVVVIVAILSGGVTSQQTGYQFTGSVPIWVIGSVVVASVLTELGPLVTALVLVGRVGARIGAELGTMVVTEQVDALQAVGRDPVVQLVVPRVLAGFLVFPPLVVLADAAGILAGWLGALLTLPITTTDFVYGARVYFHDFALWFGLIKAAVFGATVTFIGCYVGLRAQGGAEGVGRTTTTAVVAGTLAIMVWDLILVRLLKTFG